MTETTVLVVEDERMIAEDISESLQNAGYSVPEIVDCGPDALERSLALRPHLIIMDIKLKGDWDGIETAEAILKQHDCPIIYLTAFADSDVIDRAKVTNPFGYVLKPFRHRELRAMVELSLHNYRREQQNRQRQQKILDMLIHSHEAIIVTDEHGWIQFMNPEAEALTQISPAQRAQHPLAELSHWSLPPDYRSTDILKTRVNETLLLKQEDGYLPVRVSTSKLQHEDTKRVSGYIFHLFSTHQIDAPDEDTQDKLLAICASCKKIRTEDGTYVNIELYLRKKYGFRFSHGICPGCFECLYPDYFKESGH